jgi:hypothetical protein
MAEAGIEELEKKLIGRGCKDIKQGSRHIEGSEVGGNLPSYCGIKQRTPGIPQEGASVLRETVVRAQSTAQHIIE